MRTLPVHVAPLAGETTTGYLGRLAAAHGLTFEDLRVHLVNARGLRTYRPNVEHLATDVEHLAGLPTGHFADRIRTHGMYVRCSHTRWKPGRCTTCSRLQTERSGCIRCTLGTPTTTQARGGAICQRHRRWHLHDRDIDIARFAGYRRAERIVSGLLWERGIAIHTGELQLACTLIHHWLAGGEPSRVRGRARTLGLSTLDTFPDVLTAAYPEAVALSALLTDPAVITHLLDPRFSAIAQARLLEHAVCVIMRGASTTHLARLALRIISTGQVAVLSAYGLRRTASAVRAPCELSKALQVSAKTHRVCLLRHLEMRRLPHFVADKRTGGAPSTRRFNHRALVPDEIALR